MGGRDRFPGGLVQPSCGKRPSQALQLSRNLEHLVDAGIITYVGVMDKAGTVDYVAHGVSSLGMPLLVALLLCFTGAIVSAFASSTALLGAIIPLAVPFLLHGHISAVGVVAAIAISTTIVDTSPFSTNGALVVASAPDDR
ncbi:hypothetical protein ATY29_00920 [Rhizobium hidalgonense]|nr:hypothetical protein ATY29_00920 [Rhizobium hidalgonense]